MQETQVWPLGQEDPLEEEMVTHSSILAWRIPWTEKPGRLHSMGSQRVGHDWATSLLLTSQRWLKGFPDSSSSTESTCNARDLGSIPGSGRSIGEEIHYPFQYSWASLVAQLVKNLLPCRRPGIDTQVGKIPWRRKRLPIPVFLPGKPMERGAWQITVHGVAKIQT